VLHQVSKPCVECPLLTHQETAPLSINNKPAGHRCKNTVVAILTLCRIILFHSDPA